MKKIFITALCALLAVSSLSAQKHNYSNARNNKVMHKNVELTVYAAGNERFTVYIDGLPQSMKSGSRFTVVDIACC